MMVLDAVLVKLMSRWSPLKYVIARDSVFP